MFSKYERAVFSAFFKELGFMETPACIFSASSTSISRASWRYCKKFSGLSFFPVVKINNLTLFCRSIEEIATSFTTATIEAFVPEYAGFSNVANARKLSNKKVGNDVNLIIFSIEKLLYLRESSLMFDVKFNVHLHVQEKSHL